MMNCFIFCCENSDVSRWPIYFANEFGDPQCFLHLNISFSLSTTYADIKKISVDAKTFDKKIIYRILLKSSYSLLNRKKSGVTELVCELSSI